MTRRVLVADDEAAYREDLKTLLEAHNFTVDIGTNYIDAMKHLDNSEYALIVSDNKMPLSPNSRPDATCGLQLMGHARSHGLNKDTPFILHTSDDSENTKKAVDMFRGIYCEKNGSPTIGAVMFKLLGLST